MSILSFQKPNKIILNKADDFHAQFEFKPLEPGYGVTLGNSLRRVLLSSLEGYAISTIKIDGVDHEFSTVKGITEDVTEVILNLKQIRFKKKSDNDIDEEKIELKINNTTKLTAGMIGKASGVFEVTNPDLEICTIDEKANIHMELNVVKGRGYVPSEDLTDVPIGYIAIDSIFTPIENVMYSIENTRVDQRTDYEKLILEVTTDGTIHPEDAVKQASRILIQHFMIITDENISFDLPSEEKSNVIDEKVLQLRKVLKTPLEELDLSVRAFNCLKAAKINSLSELVQYTQDDLMKFRNFGQKSLSEIEQVINDRGLHFGMDLSKLQIEDS